MCCCITESNEDLYLLDDKLIALMAVEIGTNWKILGTHLGIPECKLQHINEDGKSALDKITQMLHHWRASKAESATLKELLTAMKDSEESLVDWTKIKKKAFEGRKVRC